VTQTAAPRFYGQLTMRALELLGSDETDLESALQKALLPAEKALTMPSAEHRAVWGTKGSADAVTLADIVERAERDLSEPWPQPLASQAAQVRHDGDRLAWERPAFARQQRLSRAAVAAAATAEQRWIDSTADGVWLLCEQSSWCWPAHDDVFVERGDVLADVERPFLDLGAGEVAGQLAWTDQLLGPLFDKRVPGLRRRIRIEVKRRVLAPFEERRDWHWLGLDGNAHNWNPWIHGNMLVAALRLLDAPGEEARRAHIVNLALEGLDRYVETLPPDGAIDEGYAYWWNGACRALEALDLLAGATGGILDLSGWVPALRETIAFPYRSHLGGRWYLNLADSPARPAAEQPWHAVYRSAVRAGDERAAAHAASHRHLGTPVATESDGLGRLLRGITDPAWIAAVSAPRPPMPRDVWLPSTQVLLARTEEGTSAGLTLAAKGGHNGEHHNHNDVGSFVVASDGVPVIVDAGRPTYTAATFGPHRYDIWTMQSSWHNVPEVGGHAQFAGAEFAARDVTAAVGESSSQLEMEIADAYPLAAGIRSWRRVARLERGAADSPARVVVEDAWDIAAGASVVLHILVAGEPVISNDSARIVPLDGATPLIVRWPHDATASIATRELDDSMLSAVWGSRLHRIELDLGERDTATVTVELDTRADKEKPDE
jgi:hypothetical protein